MPRKKEDKPVFQPSILTWREDQDQDPEKKEAHYSFPKGTPIWRDGHKGMVTATKSFVAKRVDGKIAGYSAFELTGNLVVYYQRGWGQRNHFTLKPGEKLGLSTSSEGFRPTKLK